MGSAWFSCSFFFFSCRGRGPASFPSGDSSRGLSGPEASVGATYDATRPRHRRDFAIGRHIDAAKHTLRCQTALHWQRRTTGSSEVGVATKIAAHQKTHCCGSRLTGTARAVPPSGTDGPLLQTVPVSARNLASHSRCSGVKPPLTSSSLAPDSCSTRLHLEAMRTAGAPAASPRARPSFCTRSEDASRNGSPRLARKERDRGTG